jgi:hypothetical protein
VIDENAGERIADGFVQENRCDGGIDPAGEPAYHFRASHLRPDARDHGVAERGHGPVVAAARDAMNEIADKRGAAWRVHNFGVKLHAIEAPPLVGNRGIGSIAGCRDGNKAVWESGDPVAMAHPHRHLIAGRAHAFEKRRCRFYIDQRRAIFAFARGLHIAAKPCNHALLAIANAEHRHARREY